MIRKKKEAPRIPTREEVLLERERLRKGSRFRKTLNSTVAILVVVAAVAILISMLWVPVLQIYGESMAPNFENGDLVVVAKNADFRTGDIIAFYYNNKILVKRVIGGAGDWINMDPDGTVYVNDAKLDEPYVYEKDLGECDLTFPYQVPDESYFVMGDRRAISIDSRSSTVGCVKTEQVVGRIVLRIWPFDRFSWI